MRKAFAALSIFLVSTLILVGRPASAAALGGTNGGDHINGSSGNDVLFGEGGKDAIFGNGGNDRIFGGGGADRLVGGPGSDVIVDDDGTGGDRLAGGSGFDTLFSLDGGADRLDCGADGGVAFADPADTVTGCRTVIRSSRNFNGFRVRVGGNGGNIFNESNDDTYTFGRNGGDLIKGSSGDDFLFGGGGTDAIQALDGDDVIVDDDSTPNESIQSGKGADVVYAADGAKTTVECEPNGNGDGADDIAFLDQFDTALHCGHVFRV